MKCLNSSNIRLMLIGFVIAFVTGAVLGQSAIISDTEVVITIAGQEHRYQPRPELGYVVKSQNNVAAVLEVYEDISLFTQALIRPVGGQERQGLWIVEKRQSAVQNKGVIKTLGDQSQVQYVAPLFSCNGETEAIIPEIVVRVTSGTQSEELLELCRVLNLLIKRRMMFTEQEYLVDVLGTNAKAVFDALIELNQIEFVQWAAPNVITQRKRPEAPVSENSSQENVHLFNALQSPGTTGLIPDDEYFPMQWHLHNTGQSGGTSGADINAPEAWQITTGDPNIIICVQDIGVELNHPDLVNNLVPGYDFYQNDDSPNPLLSSDPLEAHGMACAGLVAAEGNNGIGVTGVAWNCKVMPVRGGTWSSSISVAKEAEAIRWSAAHGADVMSYSWGYETPKPVIHSAIQDIVRKGGIGRNGKGCVVLVAAGNAAGRIPHTDTAAYPEVIGVGAADHNDQRCWYSVYGPEVDITAPSGGEVVVENLYRRNDIELHLRLSKHLLWTTDISGEAGLSKFHDDSSLLDYTGKMWGTSGAAPIAAGVAALILSVEPNLTSDEVRHFLERSAKDLGDPGRDDYYGWGRVDARAALDMVLAKRCDLNNDWCVDEEDESVLLQAMDTNDLLADIAPAAKRDCIVDEQDLELLMQYLGTDIPEIGLIAHWKLDETEGDIAYENFQGKDGNLHGAPLWQPVGGKIDGALLFDGDNDYIEINFVLNPVDGPFSAFAWVKGGAPGQIILSQIGVANWLLADPSDGNLMTELKAPGRSGKPLQSQTNIIDGEWHRIGFVWDGSNRTLYLDGIVVAEDTQANLEGSDSGLYLGCGKGMEAGTFWSGLIDDVRIYNRAVKP